MGVASLDLQQTDAGQGKIDYGNIINKPKINGITLEGDLSTEEIGIIIPTALSELENDTGFITSDVDDLVNYYDKETVDEKISLIPKFDIKVVQELPTEDISPTTLYLLVAEGDDHYVEYIYVDGEWDELGNGNIDLSDYTTYEYVNGELAKKANTVDLATVATSGSYSDLSGTPTRLGQFTNDVGYITSSALPTKTSDLTNDGEDGTSTYVESNELATVATSGSYNDLTDKPTIDFELVEMSYGESNAWAKFIDAYRGHKIVYCRASSNSNPAAGTQGRKAFMAYINNAENPTEVEFQYVRSVSSKTASQPVDQVYVYKLTSANGGTWTVQTRDMGPRLAQGTNTTVSYSNGTYTISAAQPTVNDATLTIQKNGTTVETFSANSSTNKTANITVPTKTSDVTNDSDFVNSTQVGNALAAYTYPSQDLYTQSDIDTMLAQISSLKIEVVNALPQTGNADTIYLLRVRQQGNDVYQEYFWVNNTWELIGGVDLTDYYTKTQTDTLLDAKADTSDIPTKTSELTNDSNFPVDANYVHTDNNYTTTEKNKLAGIAAGAEVNVQSNWTQTNSSADDFIKNKPSIPTKTSDLTNDSGFITSAAIPTNVSAFNNDAGYLDSIPDDSVGLNQLDDTVVNALDRINDKADTDDLATVAFSGSYNDLADKPSIPSGQIQSDWAQTDTAEVDYIKNKPTIGNATLTIQKNGTSAGTFTANATSNKTINITVPTTAADVSALPASTKYGASISVSINTTDYKVTTTLKDQDGNTLGTAQVIDLPLESVVVSGSYDSTNKKIVLTLQSGSTIDIPVGDLVAGLQTEITSTNKLASDLVDDTGQTHKFMTSAEKTKLSGIATGAEVNVQSDWTQTTTTADDYIKNKPTLATVATSGSYNDLSNKPTIPTVNNATLTIQKNGTTVKTFTANASTNVTANITVPTKTSDITNDSNFVASGDLATVATSGSYNDLSNKPTIPAAQVQSNWTQTTTTAVDYIKNKPTLATVATSGSYNDLSNKPTIPAAQVNSDWNATSGKAQILNKPSLATVATSGSYNDLSNKPTIPAAQVQSNWTQTTTTAVDYIKNKPTLATVATSGSYNDLSNKPTIPTVNNATLTIQKNGTTVKTFTANASSNVTANITVPTNNNELTNGAGYITSSGSITGNAATATKLAAGKTIAIGTGATGTATSFDGSANITIPITNIKEAYATWGGRSLASDITPDDMGCIDEFGHNKLAFLPAECIEIKYSTDGGSTWTDYGASDANKVKMVSTAGPGFYVGGSTDNATASNIANLKLRVRIAAGPTSGGKVYTAAKKILINVSTQGCSGNKVDIKYRTIANYKAGTETWTTVGTYDVAGGSGWNSIPFAYTFGGSFTSQTSQMGQIEFVFYSSGLGTWGLKKLSAIDFRMIGSTNWTMPSEMARAGHLYTVDEGQNATFPANVGVTGSLKHGSYTYTLPNKNGTVAMTSDIPSVPTVNNGQLTIQKNGSNVATFTANQSGNATANITVPTKTSDLTNDSNFVASTSLATVATSGSYNDLSNKPTIPTVNNATLTIQKNGTNVQTFTANQSTNATANITVPTKISDLTNTSGGFITYCTCSTAAATAAKVVTLDSGDSNWALRKGAIIGVKFTNSNTASSVTLNVNSSGAKSIYYNNAAYTGSSNSICGHANRYTFYMYDGTYWVWISDGRHDGNDNTYTTAYCSTAAGTAAKAATMTGYTLTANRYTVITFTNANSAASALTLNINGKGAKPLYINGAASSSSNHTLAAGSYIVYYNGTNYYINNNGEIPRMIHSESPVSTSAVTQVVSNAMIQDGAITFAKTATGEFLKLQLTTTDPGVGSALAANTLLGVYE